METHFEKNSDVSKYSIYFKKNKFKHISISHYITFLKLYVEPAKKKPKKKKLRSRRLDDDSCDYEPNKEKQKKRKASIKKSQRNNVHAFVSDRPNISIS